MKPWQMGLALAVLGWLVAMWWLAPPAAHGLDAAPGQFSGMRARAALERVIGDQPHPVGTPASRQVEANIQQELAALGLRAEVEEGTICAEHCARIRNLVVKLPGVGTPVLVSVHYDSVNSGPGAGDAGSAVATVLEVARVLQATPLKRPVHLLFNEGEEAGMLGAQVYLQTAREVGAVINLEARGTGGNAFLFELKGAALPWVRAYAAHASSPSVSSLYTAIYELMPNNTDATIYSMHGLPVANVAFLGGGVRYHTPADDLAHLDTDSVQHLGDQAIALLRGLDEIQLDSLQGEHAGVFWDVLGLFVVRLPVLPFQIGLTLLAGVQLVRIREGGLGAVFMAAFVGTSAALGALAEALRFLGAAWLGVPLVPLLGLLASVLALALLSSPVLSREGMRDAPGLVFAGLAIVVAWVLPQGAYLFLPGLLFLLPLPRQAFGRDLAPLYPLRAFLASLPLLHLGAGLVPALGLMGPLVTAAFALALLPLLPLFRDIPRPVRLAAPVLPALLLATTLFLPTATADRPTGMMAVHLTQGDQAWLHLTPSRFPYAPALEVESVHSPYRLGRHVVSATPSTRQPVQLEPLGPGSFRIHSQGAVGFYILEDASVDGVSAGPFHWLGDPDGLEVHTQADTIALIYPGAEVGELPPHTVPIHTGWQTWIAQPTP